MCVQGGPNHEHWRLRDEIESLVGSGSEAEMAVAWPSITTPRGKAYALFYCCSWGFLGGAGYICRESTRAEVHEYLRYTDPIHRDMTALSRACYMMQKGAVGFLLQQGASDPEVLKARDRDGDMAIHHACRQGPRECVHLLLQHIPDEQVQARQEGVMVHVGMGLFHRENVYPLDLAVRWGRVGVLEEVLLHSPHKQPLGRVLVEVLEDEEAMWYEVGRLMVGPLLRAFALAHWEGLGLSQEGASRLRSVVQGQAMAATFGSRVEDAEHLLREEARARRAWHEARRSRARGS
jgi:hypothetical protein